MRTHFCLLFFVIFFPFFSLAQEESEIEIIEDEVEAGNYKYALEKLDGLLKNDSLNAGLWYEMGKLQRHVQKYNSAINSFSKSYTLDSTNLKVLLSIAKTSRLAGKTSASIKNYEKLLKKEPENMAALMNLANIYRGKHKPAKAFILFERLFNLDTLNAEYLRKMAWCKRSMNEILVSFEMLKKAYGLDSTNLNVVYDLTKVYTDSQMYDSTIFVVNKTLKIYPEEGRLYSRRGRAHFKKNHHYRSVPDFEKAIELGYQSPILIKSLGKSLYTLKRYSEAQEVLNKLLVRDTMDYQVCMYMGYIHNGLSNSDSAILFFDKALEIIKPDEFVLAAIYRGKQDSYGKKGLYYKEIEMVRMRQEAMTEKYFSDHYLLEIAEIYENDIKDKERAIDYYSKYYKKIKDANWYSEENKNALETKINRLREDLHFESNKPN